MEREGGEGKGRRNRNSEGKKWREREGRDWTCPPCKTSCGRLCAKRLCEDDEYA